MQPELTLLCLPCAGASATMYLRWRRVLPTWLHVAPVELPGRGSRLGEPCVEDYASLVAQLCDEQAAALSGRYALLGHSMGALLAYGMALRQRQLGRPLPLALLASGSPAPARRVLESYPAKDDDAALVARMRQQGGTPEGVYASAELMRLTLDVLGADYRVCESFVAPAPAPLPFPLHVFGGRRDDIGAVRMQAWSALAGAGFSLDWFDGGHFFIRQQEGAVLAALAGRLAHARIRETI